MEMQICVLSDEELVNIAGGNREAYELGVKIGAEARRVIDGALLLAALVVVVGAL